MTLAAQLCVGNAAFAISHFTAAARADFDPVAQRFTLELRYNTHHLFGAAEFGVKSWETTTSFNGDSKAYSLTLGIDKSSQKSKFGFCPMLYWSRLSGPNQINGTAYSFSDQTLAAEFSAGFLMYRSQLWDFMPTANITFGTVNPQLIAPGGHIGEYHEFCCGKQSFTTFGLGIGLGYSDDLTLIPSITWPLNNPPTGQKGAQKTYAIRVTFRIGKGV